jgi:hypothetical protein
MEKRFSKTVILDKSEVTPQGFLKIPAYLTRTGVFTYRRGDGRLVRELRHPDDVFETQSIRSLSMAPVTDDHPEEFVSPANVKQLSVGWISDRVIKEDDKLKSDVVVSDQEAISKVGRGKVEVSLGYFADVVDEEGEFEGQKYDSRQTNIRYNHVALVDRGRMGPQVRLITDAAEVCEDQQNTEDKMPKVKFQDKEMDLEDAFKAASTSLAELQEKLDAAEKAKAELVAKLDEKKAEDDKEEKDEKEEKDDKDKMKEDRDVLLARIDTLEEKLADSKPIDPETIRKMVRDRSRLERAAREILEDASKIDSLEDVPLMKECIKVRAPKADLSDKSEVYIRARFDALTEDLERRSETAHSIGSKIKDRGGDVVDSKKARQDAMERERERWKQPLAAAKK